LPIESALKLDCRSSGLSAGRDVASYVSTERK
jgi:hypothetical protein